MKPEGIATAPLFDGAIEEARCRRHLLVKPEHVLYVLAEMDAIKRELQRRGISVAALVDDLEDFFALEPTAFGYRDVNVMPSSHLARTLKDVDDPSTILGSFLSDGRARILVFADRLDRGATNVLRRSLSRASSAAHRELGAAHVLRALLDVPAVAIEIERIGNLDCVIEALDNWLSTLPTYDTDLHSSVGNTEFLYPRLSSWIVEFCARERAHLISSDALAVGLVLSEEVAPLFALVRVDRFALLYGLVHKSMLPNIDSEFDLAQSAQIKPMTLHNDAVSSPDAMVLLLRQVFRYSERDAIELKNMIIENGLGVVGNYPVSDALQLWRKAVEWSRIHMTPVRISLG